MKDIALESKHSTVERFTISVPRYLFDWGERERENLHLNRSEFVAYLYQHLLEEVEYRHRLQRYTEAYARIPETPAEQALSEVFMASVSDAES